MNFWLEEAETQATSCHAHSPMLVFSGSRAVLLSLCLWAHVPCAVRAPHHDTQFVTGQSHVSAEVTGSPEFTFLATCHFSPGMEKVVSFPHTAPYWEQSSSFPLRGRVPLPFFTGWTSANESHYWVHSIYLSRDILADLSKWREIPFTGHCLTSAQSDVQRENEAENDGFHPVEVGTFLRPGPIRSMAISIPWVVPFIFAQMSACRNIQNKAEAFSIAFNQNHYVDFFPFL